MSHSRFIELLAKKESGEITLKEQKELSDLVATNEKLGMLADALNNSFQELPPFNKMSEESLEAKWQQFSEKIKQDDRKGNTQLTFVKRYRPLLVAASIIAIVALSVLWLLRSEKPVQHASSNIVSTKRGSKSNIVLPDGTQVWLNADTKIIYDKGFGGTTREITLTGEAFFDVTHDASKPFIIHTGIADIKVLGTAFNLRNYNEDDYVEAALIRGKIEVVYKDQPENHIILKPSQKIVIRKKIATTIPANNVDKKYKIEKPDIFTLMNVSVKDSMVAETSWVENKTIYINKPLYDIVKDLERRFDIKVSFGNEEVKNYKYTIYTGDLVLDEIMKVLKMSKNIDYRINNNELIIN